MQSVSQSVSRRKGGRERERLGKEGREGEKRLRASWGECCGKDRRSNAVRARRRNKICPACRLSRKISLLPAIPSRTTVSKPFISSQLSFCNDSI